MNWKGFSIAEVERDSLRSNWKPLWGTRQNYPDNHNALTLELKDENSYTSFLLRMYDEGLVFKYKIEN
ncbi:glycoside hydrolase family 97 N-terminal domain-containing protein [Cellulophaga sp. L1A9]|uniref:glycoside hydrolase family 97 N-terminal domain-containing protein n=1 Tax=Cellulophaga sp. L1A9 TaxID=2686362 RepID=UPI00131C2946|nr:glycoside hydrolase family 97 N-terminal domain-containing protein [Cellulophaga sp. L1A9]